jgi:hypothetical protein
MFQWRFYLDFIAIILPTMRKNLGSKFITIDRQEEIFTIKMRFSSLMVWERFFTFESVKLKLLCFFQLKFAMRIVVKLAQILIKSSKCYQ